MAKWLLVKDGIVRHSFAPRGESWLRHYKASKFTVLEVEDSEPAVEGWLYQDGSFSPPPLPPEPPPEP